jgi:SOS-response transcriptional repressor LexA
MKMEVPQSPFDVRRQSHKPPRQLGFRAVQVLTFIRDHMEKHGRPPSYRIISDALMFNDEADVCKCVTRLERRGIIVRIAQGPDWNSPVIRLVG